MTRDPLGTVTLEDFRRPDGRRSRSSTGTSVAVGFKIQIASRILPELHDLRRRLVLSRQVFTAARRTPREQRLSAFQRLAMEDGFTQTTLLRHSFRVSPLLFRFQHGLTPLAPAPLRRFPRVASGVHRKYPAPGGDAITLRMMAAPTCLRSLRRTPSACASGTRIPVGTNPASVTARTSSPAWSWLSSESSGRSCSRHAIAGTKCERRAESALPPSRFALRRPSAQNR